MQYSHTCCMTCSQSYMHTRHNTITTLHVPNVTCLTNNASYAKWSHIGINKDFCASGRVQLDTSTGWWNVDVGNELQWLYQPEPEWQQFCSQVVVPWLAACHATGTTVLHHRPLKWMQTNYVGVVRMCKTVWLLLASVFFKVHMQTQASCLKASWTGCCFNDTTFKEWHSTL